MKMACIGLAGLGLITLLLGIFWGVLFPPENRWTEEKATRMSELNTEAHGLHMRVKMLERGNTRYLGDDEPGEVRERYNTVVKERDELKADFESATETPKTVANILRIAGMVLLLGGLVGVRASAE